MDIIIFPDAESASLAAARHIAAQIRSGEVKTLGLAAGSTPALVYRELIRIHQEDGLDFSGISAFILDEYAGLAAGHPGSFARQISEALLDRLDMSPKRIHFPDGMAEDMVAECEFYEAAIEKAGFVDLQILGIGLDGHLGFNAPGSSLSSRTRCVALTGQTRGGDPRFFNSLEEVPAHGITMGLGTILDSHAAILLAFGKDKAEAIAAAVEGPASAICPASVLQLHGNVRLYIDEAAASLLKLKDDYKAAWEKRPGRTEP
jgi:glucosamine-6-phosphate deaminase